VLEYFKLDPWARKGLADNGSEDREFRLSDPPSRPDVARIRSSLWSIAAPELASACAPSLTPPASSRRSATRILGRTGAEDLKEADGEIIVCGRMIQEWHSEPHQTLPASRK